MFGFHVQHRASYLSFTLCVGTSSLCVLWESPWLPAAAGHRSPETHEGLFNNDS